MLNKIQPVLNKVYNLFKECPANMLIVTGAAGWALSSMAQIGAVLFNNKISDEKKSFLVPQEMADAAVNIASFLVVTMSLKRLVNRLFACGKFGPKSVREYVKKQPCASRIGKLDFDLEAVFSNDKYFPKNDFETYKNIGTTLAAAGGGIISSNIITPILRNRMAANMQKNYINYEQNKPARPSSNMRI